MFLIESTPFNPINSYSPVGLFEHEVVSDRYNVQIPIETNQASNILVETIDLTEVALEQDIASFLVDETINNVVQLAIGEKEYVLARDRNNLESGEYYFDFDSKKVYLKLVENTSLVRDAIAYQVQVLATQGYSFSEPTTQICSGSHPLLSKWNATGKISIRRGFRQEPSFSFEFQTCKSNKASILNQLANGTIHACFGIKWRVASLTISDRAYQNVIYVRVSLKHFLAATGSPSVSPLDKPVRYTTGFGAQRIYTRSKNVSQFTSEAGVPFREGGAASSVRIGRSVKATETTTARSLINSRAIISGTFPFYSGDGVEMRSWRNTRTHFISDSDLRKKSVAFNYGGQGNILDGVQLSKELRNIKVNLDFDQEALVENQGIHHQWTFENCVSLADFNSPIQEENGVLRQPDATILQSPGINFDVSGAFIKFATRTSYLNGTPIFELKRKAGYAFATSSGSAGGAIYRIIITNQGYILRFNPLANPASFWSEFSSQTTDWQFDGDGYLTAIITRGNEMSRLQQETEKKEAVVYKARAIKGGRDGIPDPFLEAQSEAYEFTRNLPVSEYTKFVLSRHQDYFDDVVRAEDCEDPDFVEPKFVKQKILTRRDTYVAPNPKNTEFITYPPIETGKVKDENEIINITSTGRNPKYEVSHKINSSQGEGLKNSSFQSTVSYHEGKPPIQKRLDTRVDFENTNLNSNWAYDLYHDENYYLSSIGVIFGSVKTQEGSKSYPDIDSPFKVRAIAETELSIENTQSSLTTEIDIFYREGIEEGDNVIFRGRKWKIFNITDSRSLESNGRMKSDGLVLSLGAYLEPRLNLHNRSNCNSSSVSAIAVTAPVIPEEPIPEPIPEPDHWYRFENNLEDSQSG